METARYANAHTPEDAARIVAAMKRPAPATQFEKVHGGKLTAAGEQ